MSQVSPATAGDFLGVLGILTASCSSDELLTLRESEAQQTYSYLRAKGAASLQDGGSIPLGLPLPESEKATRLQGCWGEKTRTSESARSLFNSHFCHV